MGTLEQWEKDLLGQVKQKEVQSDPSGNGGGCCCLGAVLIALVLLALVVNSWAACRPYSEWQSGVDASSCAAILGQSGYSNVMCYGGEKFCGPNAGNYGNRVTVCALGYESCSPGRNYCCESYANCFICTNECESDSLDCVVMGGMWEDDPNTTCGKTCKRNNCTADDSVYIAEAKASCEANGGTNDLELVSNNDGTCGISGFCDLCTDKKKKSVIDNAKKSCCELGSGFKSENFKFSCKTTIDGLEKTWDYTYKGCEYNYSVSVGTNGSTVAEGCGPENSGSSDSQGGSSDSQGGSSDSQGGSSDSQGGENPSDTTGTGGSSSSGASLLEERVEDIAENIAKQTRQDSANLANVEDIKQILLDFMRCVYSEDCPLNKRDTTIVNVDGGGGNVSVDLTALTAAVNAGNAIGESNGEKLDSINARLGSLGLDSIRAAIVAGDSSIKAAMDELGGIIAGLDSTAAGIASRLDSNRAILGSIDSTLKVIGDTTGGGGFDTSGYMAILRGWGDSLGMAIWNYPCDTTGGKKCDNAYIGADGLVNARRDFAAAGSALVDSITGGAVGDSLAKWSQVIKTGGGVLSGDGSANCPSVFTRVYNVPLGPAGLYYPFGPFSSIVCYDFGFGLTFWALARVVLRALVAISCMWWIFKAATGTEGGNDED